MEDSIFVVSLMVIVFYTIFTFNVMGVKLAKEKLNFPFYCIEAYLQTPI